jgi:hypothetical protein
MSSPSRKVLLSHPPHPTGSIGRCAQCGNWAKSNARTRKISISTRVADLSPGTNCRDVSDHFIYKDVSPRAETGKRLRNTRRKICVPVLVTCFDKQSGHGAPAGFRNLQSGWVKACYNNSQSKITSMNDEKKPWYQLRDSETKWYHHLMHGRVLIMLVLMAIVALLALGVAIWTLFGT